MSEYKKYYTRDEEGQCYSVCLARKDPETDKSTIKIGSASCTKCTSFIRKGHHYNKYYVICKVPNKEL